MHPSSREEMDEVEEVEEVEEELEKLVEGKENPEDSSVSFRRRLGLVSSDWDGSLRLRLLLLRSFLAFFFA